MGKRILSAAVLTASLLAGAAACYGYDDPAAPVDPPVAAPSSAANLPVSAKVFESNKAFGFVKRVNGDGVITWFLQVNSTDEAFRIQEYGLSVAHYDAVFLDGDGVSVGTVRVYPHSNDVAVGELVKYTLTLPTDDSFAGAKSVVIRLRDK